MPSVATSKEATASRALTTDRNAFVIQPETADVENRDEAGYGQPQPHSPRQSKKKGKAEATVDESESQLVQRFVRRVARIQALRVRAQPLISGSSGNSGNIHDIDSSDYDRGIIPSSRLSGYNVHCYVSTDHIPLHMSPAAAEEAHAEGQYRLVSPGRFDRLRAPASPAANRWSDSSHSSKGSDDSDGDGDSDDNSASHNRSEIDSASRSHSGSDDADDSDDDDDDDDSDEADSSEASSVASELFAGSSTTKSQDGSSNASSNGSGGGKSSSNSSGGGGGSSHYSSN